MALQEKESILKKVVDIFTTKIKAPVSDNVTDTNTVQTTEVKNVDSSNSEPRIPIYAHGFHNALYRITPENDAFIHFLRYDKELKKIKDFQQINNNSLQIKEKKLEEAEIAVIRILKDETDAETSMISFKKEQSDYVLKKQEWEGNSKVLNEKKENTKPEYGWVPALMYFLAGVLFVIGDISITSSITSIGFDMSRDEGRFFAVGLALTVFLIKPAIDRILEKPYQKNGFILNRLFKGFLLFTTMFGLVMLFFLGQFRATAKSSMAELEQISKDQKKPGISNLEIVELQRRTAEVSKVQADSWYGKWGMTLSTLVFAIGGAVCLSVSLPSLTALSNKYWFIPFRIRMLTRDIEEVEKQILLLQKDIDASTKVFLHCKKEYSLLDIEVLKSEILLLKAEREKLLVEFHECRFMIDESYYKDGYNRGKVYNLEGDLNYRVANPLNLQNYVEERRDGSDEDSKDVRTYTRRPFVKLRKMIADNYNKNQKTKDETEFEIIT
jgi:hypothetical protein